MKGINIYVCVYVHLSGKCLPSVKTCVDLKQDNGIICVTPVTFLEFALENSSDSFA